jgi:4-hydroxy-tetrahydrodipicolinate synthase
MERSPFSGVMTAVVTPFCNDGNIDFPAFRKILTAQKQNGVHGAVVAGTTGESPTLTLAEKQALVEAALELQDADFSVYAGTGTNATASTIQLTKELSAIEVRGERVKGAMVVTPYYNRPNQAGLTAHFSSVARAFPHLSFCLYNVPGRTGADLLPGTAVGLASQYSNIVAIKEAAGRVTTIAELKLAIKAQNLTQTFTILSGDDATYPAALLMGAEGLISVTSHVIPRTMVDILRAARAGDFERVQLLGLAAYPLGVHLFCAPNPVPVKYALARAGYCNEYVREPLVSLSESERSIVQGALESAAKLGAWVL